MEDVIAIIMVFSVPIVGVIALGPIGKAIGERLRGGASRQDHEELEAMREQLQGLQEQVSELAERQDFTERVVAQVRERGAIGSGPTP